VSRDDVVPATLTLQRASLKLKAPFAITGHVFTAVDVLRVTLAHDGHNGRGEAAGVYYRYDTPDQMLTLLEGRRTEVERGISREQLQRRLPPGGARNALDCALWELQAKLAGEPVWRLAMLASPTPLVTTFTCSADSPAAMAAAALGFSGARAIKLKLTGDSLDAERVQAVRDVRPDVWLGVDANQGFSKATLESLMPQLVDAGVKLIEQPFPVGREADLDGLDSPIPVAADESVQCLADLPSLVGRFHVINIKLDKCGGLTEALEMARRAKQLGLEVMVGNMMGTSLAMAPAYLVGQLATIADLDGPIYIERDIEPSAEYSSGLISCPPGVWGW
jgi:L-Ala-D/L-Glu epimerase